MIEYFIVLAVCVMGVGYTSYKIGIKEGSEGMLGLLENLGVINMDDEGNVSPNLNYKPIKRKV